ncbi:MAG: IS3 family transposase [Elusimicrobia bacterium]|nr:IS3 family transposase [Elusimicrobiota bacterium]
MLRQRHDGVVLSRWKTEHTYWQSYGSREEAEHSLFDYIELFYNAERRHFWRGYKSPSAFEKQNS